MAKAITLFVYGTINAKQFDFNGIKYKPLERAILDNARLIFKSKYIPVHSFEKAQGKKLYGFIYKVKVSDLEKIKRFLRESYLYSMIKIKLRTQSGKTCEAITFRIKEIDNGKHGSVKYRYEPPKKGFYDDILNNLNNMGWDKKSKDYLDKAVHYSLSQYYKGDYNTHEYEEEKE